MGNYGIWSTIISLIDCNKGLVGCRDSSSTTELSLGTKLAPIYSLSPLSPFSVLIETFAQKLPTVTVNERSGKHDNGLH